MTPATRPPNWSWRWEFHFFPHPGQDFKILLWLVGQGCEGSVGNSAIAFPTSRIKGFFFSNVCLTIPHLNLGCPCRWERGSILQSSALPRRWNWLIFGRAVRTVHSLVSRRLRWALPLFGRKYQRKRHGVYLCGLRVTSRLGKQYLREKRLVLAVNYCKKFDDCLIYADVCDKGIQKINA